MNKKNLINVHITKRDLSETMSAYADYLQHQPADMARMMKFTLLATYILSEMDKHPSVTMDIDLQSSTVKNMVHALHWAKGRSDYKVSDLTNALDPLQEALGTKAVKNINHVAQSTAKQRPSFTRKDIPIIALAVKSYIPRLIKLSGGKPAMSLKIILPGIGDDDKLDQNSINTISHAFAYGYKHNWKNVSPHDRAKWMQVWSKIASLQMLIMHNILKRLDKDVRMAQHSFVREALDDIFLKMAKDNRDYSQSLAEAAVKMHGEHELINLQSTIKNTQDILKHADEAKEISDNAPLLKRFMKRLTNMQKRGYHYVIVRDHSLEDYSLRHVQPADVSQLVTNLRQSF